MDECFYCNKKIGESKYFLLGLDIPYINLYFHLSCYQEIDDIETYLKLNAERIYRLLDDRNRETRRKRESK